MEKMDVYVSSDTEVVVGGMKICIHVKMPDDIESLMKLKAIATAKSQLIAMREKYKFVPAPSVEPKPAPEPTPTPAPKQGKIIGRFTLEPTPAPKHDMGKIIGRFRSYNIYENIVKDLQALGDLAKQTTIINRIAEKYGGHPMTIRTHLYWMRTFLVKKEEKIFPPRKRHKIMPKKLPNYQKKYHFTPKIEVVNEFENIENQNKNTLIKIIKKHHKSGTAKSLATNLSLYKKVFYDMGIWRGD